MMSKYRKRFMLFFVIGLFFSLVACSGDTDTTTDNDSETTVDVEIDGDLEPITFSLFAADNNPDWDGMNSPIGQEILKATGVTLETDYAIGDPAERISLFAAGGDYPDFMLPKGDGNLLVEAGAMVDLRPLIEEHAPNIQEIYGEYLERMVWSDDDDSIYFIGTNPVDEEYRTPGNGFWLQHAVVEELGYPEINTLEDFENAIRTYYEMYPEIDGQPTIPLTLLADDWRLLISVTNPAFLSTGAPDDGEWYIDQDTYEAKLHYKRPEEREYFRWLNHMNAEGLLDSESFVQQEDQYKSKISSGRVLGMIDAEWSIADTQTALREDGKFERMHGVYPVTLDETYKHGNFKPTGYLSTWGIGITVDNPDPVRAIQFLDWMASEEAQILNNWGIEGEHYQVDEEGNRYLTEEQREERRADSTFNERTGINVFKAYGPHYGNGVLDSSGQPFTINTPETLIEDYTAVEKEVLAAYGAEIWKDLFPQEDEFRPRPYGAAWEINYGANSPIAVPFQRAQDVMFTRIPQVILARPDQFDEIYDQFMDEISTDAIEEAEREFTNLVRNRVELWGGN
ncbi:ABC transporter substrate-binding protein [Alkalihalobacillus alcalophilus ATCC 27647 = CGMCC 1.3604]|uniref:ABC transporter substrate-binding protein n=1 Tax=Alkalihalobacillus alcalophilus ATCC 27647 = CGMCC 1.3604 TaxID=1218173 RepID=A0A094YZG5_ALKAL|nr:extracellular solute-binding protein [Alkalihalobacillus alcalophilus]KGA98957.1 ABC transporter substrate-binding protein [Alkalihalobacillus alcalophilus ATCC 27647 = CGMCC 1.3604]MED1561994.1 ABC transporter substrate-binding protein [Alkalihalobacillus alcalophilus]THG89142.1 ABC transporter substrate-binding protein [Alkalihalobacillus alcalophilus ATCC 27647 = CGMCC 1.3604]